MAERGPSGAGRAAVAAPRSVGGAERSVSAVSSFSISRGSRAEGPKVHISTSKFTIPSGEARTSGLASVKSPGAERMSQFSSRIDSGKQIGGNKGTPDIGRVHGYQLGETRPSVRKALNQEAPRIAGNGIQRTDVIRTGPSRANSGRAEVIPPRFAGTAAFDAASGQRTAERNSSRILNELPGFVKEPRIVRKDLNGGLQAKTDIQEPKQAAKPIEEFWTSTSIPSRWDMPSVSPWVPERVVKPQPIVVRRIDAPVRRLQQEQINGASAPEPVLQTSVQSGFTETSVRIPDRITTAYEQKNVDQMIVVRQKIAELVQEQTRPVDAIPQKSVRTDAQTQHTPQRVRFETPWEPQGEPQRVGAPTSVAQPDISTVSSAQPDKIALNNAAAARLLLEELEAKRKKKKVAKEGAVSSENKMKKVALQTKIKEGVKAAREKVKQKFADVVKRTKKPNEPTSQTAVDYRIDEVANGRRKRYGEQAISLVDQSNDPKQILSIDAVLANMYKVIKCDLANKMGLPYDGSFAEMIDTAKKLGNGTPKQVRANLDLATELNPGVAIWPEGKEADEDDVVRVIGRQLPKKPEEREEALSFGR